MNRSPNPQSNWRLLQVSIHTHRNVYYGCLAYISYKYSHSYKIIKSRNTHRNSCFNHVQNIKTVSLLLYYIKVTLDTKWRYGGHDVKTDIAWVTWVIRLIALINDRFSVSVTITVRQNLPLFMS